MSKKRRRQLDLIGEIVLGLTGTVMFGFFALVNRLSYDPVAESINQSLTGTTSRKPLFAWMEATIGPNATTTVCFVVLALLCLFIAIRAIRLLRNKAYLEARAPT